MKIHQPGFTLMDLIVFIVVIGLVVAAIMVPLALTNEKSPTDTYTSIATALARERMELIVGQRHFQGFSSFSDPCTGGSPPADCTMTGYTINSTITTGATISGDSGYDTITVTVTGNGNATLTSLVGNY